jgi:hypothetical protein
MKSFRRLDSLELHPNRWAKQHPFFEDFLPEYRSKVGAGGVSVEISQGISRRLLSLCNADLDKLHYSERPKDFNEMDLMSYLITYLGFVVHGRNIFVVPEYLVDMFEKTDVDEVMIDQIRFPFKMFYIHLSKQISLNGIEGNPRVDGAYIDASQSGVLQIKLSTNRTADIPYDSLAYITNPDKYFFFPIGFQSGATVSEAIELFFNEHSEMTKAMPAFRSALHSVVNTIYYLTSNSDDCHEMRPSDTDQNLLNELDKAKGYKKLRKAEVELSRAGYNVVKICGKSISQRTIEHSQGEMSSHWRRGHWRNQACGKDRAEHRLLWIMPTLVRSDKGDAAKGHIYRIEDASAKQG